MRHIYSNIYVEYIVKDPLYVPGQPFDNSYFTATLNQYAKQCRGI